MNSVWIIAIAALAWNGTEITPVGDPGQGAWNQFVRPQDAGFAPDRLNLPRNLAEEIGSAAVMVVVDGAVVVAWGDVKRRFKCHSVRKSLVSALYGVHVERGTIDLEVTLDELEIDDHESLTDIEKDARIVDLLRARSGIYHRAAKEPKDMKDSRPGRGSREPDELWWYNNWDFNTLGTIFEQETGHNLFQEFEECIARPLGMEDFRVRDGLKQLEPSRSRHAAHAFRMSARDLARVGWLFANQGRWDGAQVVPAGWVKESTSCQSTFEDETGYGYMWWSYPAGTVSSHPNLNRYDKFMARGTGGQVCFVVPEAGFVFVHRGDTDNDRHVSGSGIWKLAELLLAARSGESVTNPEFKELEATPFEHALPAPTEHEVTTPTAPLETYAGNYLLMPGMEMRIWVYQDRLFATTPKGELELYPEGSHRFFGRAANLTLEFQLGETGEVDSVHAKFEGVVAVASRQK